MIFIHSGPNSRGVPPWHSSLPEKLGNCAPEWFLYAPLALCSPAAAEPQPFPSINTPLPPFL